MEDAELKDLVKKMRDDGMSLNEILDALHKEHEVKLTFLDLRMLVAEIEKSQPVEKAPPKKEKPKEEGEEPATPGGASIEIDQIMQPGAQISGSASLPSGAKVKWFVDEMGRLGMNLAPGSEQPTESDIQAFRQALAQKLQGGA